jgi:hypothetical protein
MPRAKAVQEEYAKNHIRCTEESMLTGQRAPSGFVFANIPKRGLLVELLYLRATRRLAREKKSA